MPGVGNAMLALLLGSAVNSGGAKQPMNGRGLQRLQIRPIKAKTSTMTKIRPRSPLGP